MNIGKDLNALVDSIVNKSIEFKKEVTIKKKFTDLLIVEFQDKIYSIKSRFIYGIIGNLAVNQTVFVDIRYLENASIT